jgi:hypothetical protein
MSSTRSPDHHLTDSRPKTHCGDAADSLSKELTEGAFVFLVGVKLNLAGVIERPIQPAMQIARVVAAAKREDASDASNNYAYFIVMSIVLTAEGF